MELMELMASMVLLLSMRREDSTSPKFEIDDMLVSLQSKSTTYRAPESKRVGQRHEHPNTNLTGSGTD